MPRVSRKNIRRLGRSMRGGSGNGEGNGEGNENGEGNGPSRNGSVARNETRLAGNETISGANLTEEAMRNARNRQINADIEAGKKATEERTEEEIAEANRLKINKNKANKQKKK